MSTESKSKCPQCGAALPPHSPGGLCPRCLMALNLATQTDFTGANDPQVQNPPPPPPSVQEIAGYFPQLEIIECLGRGGMGIVYKARQPRLNRFVALKILAPEREHDAAFAARFEKEAQALAQLNHPGIVTLYEFGVSGTGVSPVHSPTDDNPEGTSRSTETGRMPVPLYFFLMEFVDGVNLRQLLQAGRISPREALAIVPQICDALQYAHDAGIVHRDIKPENILLDRRGRVKVADFGLAKLVEGRAGSPLPAAGLQMEGGAPGVVLPTNDLTDAGKIMGTPQYMSPEQISAPGEVDHRADIYALGVVFYQMLTGELPGRKLEAPSKKVQIDVRLDEVVMRALEKNPERRYQQASVLKTQVETIVSTPGSSGRESAPSQPPLYPGSESGLTSAATSQGVRHPRGSRSLIVAPAIGMMLVSILNLGSLLFGLVLLGGAGLLPRLIGAGPMPVNVRGSFLPATMGVGAVGLLMVVWTLVWLAANAVAFVGGLRMVQLRQYRLALAGSIILIVGGLHGLVFSRGGWVTGVLLLLLELGVGIWALVVLLRSEVKEAFARGKAGWESGAASGSPVPETAEVTKARKRVSVPAVGLMVAAGLSLLVLGVALAVLLFGTSWQTEGGKETLILKFPGFSFSRSRSPAGDMRPWWMLLGPVVLLGGMGAAVTTFLGAWRMRQLRSYRLAVTGAILGLFTPPGLLLGLIFGLWSLVVLMKKQVREAFLWRRTAGTEKPAPVAAGIQPSPRKTPVGKWLLMIGGGIAGLGVLLLGLWFLLFVLPRLQHYRSGAGVTMVPFVGLILGAGFLALILVLVIGLILFLRRKNSAGTGKAFALGCGVLGVGGLVFLGLVMTGLFFFRAQRVAVMEHRAEQLVQQDGARAVERSELGTIHSPFPHSAHIGRNDRSILIHHDGVVLHYALCYAGDFGTATRDSHNPETGTWQDDGSLTLKNGRTFGYLRESSDPEHLRINGRGFDLSQGRVFLLQDDGIMTQLELFPALALAKDVDSLFDLWDSTRNGAQILPDSSTSNPPVDFKSRLVAAESILTVAKRDEALSAIAADAARMGDTAMTRVAVGKIMTVSTHDAAICSSAHLLVAAGKRTSALELAESVMTVSIRDGLILELAQSGTLPDAAGNGVPTPAERQNGSGPSLAKFTDLKARLSAAGQIAAFPERDEVLAAIAADAARAGEVELTRTAVQKMTAFTARDAAICVSARLLVGAGKRAEALDLARLVTAFPTRGDLIRELAK